MGPAPDNASPIFFDLSHERRMTMKLLKQSTVSVLLALCAAASWAQVSDTTPVIEAGSTSMSKAEFEMLVSGDSRYQAAMSQPAARREIAESFARAFALEAEARKRKLDQLPGVQLRMRHAIQQMLAYELTIRLRADLMKDEAKLAAHYEQNKTFFSQPKVRQIFVRAKGSQLAQRVGSKELSIDEARAKAVALRARLAGGADFATLAKSESDDLGSRDKGGDMGFLTRGASGANFEAAAYTLPLNKLSDVVQTENGFHILRVEERQAPPLAGVKAALANDLAHREIEAIVTRGYKLNEAYFAP